ncbi:hypothetical protein JTE90_029643 [Oedothorax gibbosus]|uniref:Uncharacterized protein n=1 Tax=Oedothorax gibbosus TaxID=931172 RepID=A0AAV6VEE0_9ARAC|nr:hypothetical protein JTE90_029643 [Oedothorax gibbosus]
MGGGARKLPSNGSEVTPKRIRKTRTIGSTCAKCARSEERDRCNRITQALLTTPEGADDFFPFTLQEDALEQTIP